MNDEKARADYHAKALRELVQSLGVKLNAAGFDAPTVHDKVDLALAEIKRLRSREILNSKGWAAITDAEARADRAEDARAREQAFCIEKFRNLRETTDRYKQALRSIAMRDCDRGHDDIAEAALYQSHATPPQPEE